MSGGWLDRPHIKPENFGKPLRCPVDDCGYGILKTPHNHLPRQAKCPNCGATLVGVRRKVDKQ